MIAYLEGRLEFASETSIIVVTDGGVGYELEISSSTRQALPELGQRVCLHTVFLVREDFWRLCGFLTKEEKDCFSLLLSIQKVGPRMALNILSCFRPDQLYALVIQGNGSALTKVPGIGKRSAETIFHELSYKWKGSPVPSVSEKAASPIYKDVMDGLLGLGYAETECSPIVRAVLKSQPDIDVPSALRASLKALAKPQR